MLLFLRGFDLLKSAAIQNHSVIASGFCIKSAWQSINKKHCHTEVLQETEATQNLKIVSRDISLTLNMTKFPSLRVIRFCIFAESNAWQSISSKSQNMFFLTL
ncbi:hypothetical protein [Helicobacter sp. T3_23-1056]